MGFPIRFIFKFLCSARCSKEDTQAVVFLIELVPLTTANEMGAQPCNASAAARRR